MAHHTDPRTVGPDPRFIPDWIRERTESWLVEALRLHPDDVDAAVAAVMERVAADPRIVRAIGEAWARGVLLEGGLQRGQALPETVTPLVAEVDRVREQLSGGRLVACAADVLREVREEESMPQ